MQHNNNNLNIAEKLDKIVLSLSELDTDSVSESLQIIETGISHFESLSQEMGSPELRALAHWLMLNIELDDENEDQISTLLAEGSYYLWMDTLSSLVLDYNHTLLPDIYMKLTKPNWVVNPSTPLLRNLAQWIKTTKNATAATSGENKESQFETVSNDTNSNELIVDDIDSEDVNRFEKIDASILEKNYNSSDIKKPQETDIKENKFIFTTEKTSVSYEEVVDTVDHNTTQNISLESPQEPTTNDVETLEALDSETDDFSIEVDDIVMTLTSLSATTSDNALNITDEYINELQRLNMLAEILGYSQIGPISNWCQRNLILFSEEPSDSTKLFIETGECWTWIELIKLALAEPDELEIISELHNELIRKEWAEPLAMEDLQNIILFLQDPNDTDVPESDVAEEDIHDHYDHSIEADASIEQSSDTSEFSFKWDDDIHPELLEIYLEETSENISDLCAYIENIDTSSPTKEQRQDARRIAHTIKGGSAIAGITALSTIAYEFEKVLDHAIDHSLSEDGHTILKVASNCVSQLFDAVKNKKEEPLCFSKSLFTLTLYAELIENTDDEEPLELDMPVIPDFIKKQNSASKSAVEELNMEDTQLSEELLIENTASIEDNNTEDTLTSEENINEDSTIEYTSSEEGAEKIIAEDTSTSEELDIEDNITTENILFEDATDSKEMINTDTASITEDFIEETSTVSEDLTNENIVATNALAMIGTIATSNLIDQAITTKDNIEEIKEGAVEESTLPVLDQSDELHDFTLEIDDIVMTLVTTKVNMDTDPYQLSAYIEELQRLDMLAEISGYPKIVKISSWYQNNLQLMAEEPSDEIHHFITSGESWAWLELISACIADTDEISHLSALSSELTRSEWIDSINIEDLQSLLLMLKNTNESTASLEKSDIETEEIIIHEDRADIDSKTIKNIVTWDEDVHPELLSVYLQETSEQIINIAALLQKIAKRNATKEDQENAARIAHTIKGASGVVGISEIVDLTHKLEDILDYAVNNKIPDDTAELLAESSDCLESLFEAVQEKAEVPEEYQPLLGKLTAYAEHIEKNIVAVNLDDAPELDMPSLPDFVTSSQNNTADHIIANVHDIEEIENSAVKVETIELSEQKQEIVDTSNNIFDVAEPVEVIQAPTTQADNIHTTDSHIRVPTALINKLLNLAGELVTASSQVSDKVEKTLSTSVNIKEQDVRVHKMLNELSTTIHEQEKDQVTLLSSMQNKDFDSLEMDTYNELHSVTSLLTESILDSEAIESTLEQQLSDIHNDLRLLDNLNKELSDTILNSRMESLNTLVPRLERIVRQTCRKTNKKAELVVFGNDINIDTDILRGLVDPLLHLLRNAIDHGIEPSDIRKLNKKDETGSINLKFARQGNFIHMRLTDDGAGIDSEKIYLHAIDSGLITPDQEFSKDEVLKLILEPGFSTQKDVTDISGRGVGMDVVNKGIEALKGTLSISSELGKGTSFDIKIPLTLVTSTTLLVSAAGNQVAVPTDTIEQLYYLSPEDVLSRNDEKFIRHEGKELPIESLADILGWQATDVDFTKAQTLLLVKGNQQIHAIHIDKIIHSREVVIKNLAYFIGGENGVVGACHLSDGAVAPVMNLPLLLKRSKKSNYVIKQVDTSEIKNTNRTPQILVVDDSLSNRKALSLIIDKTEYDVITAVDGLDALNIMNEKHIDLIFTDLEMPRMTGLELTQVIRTWDDKKEIPIVMVTSRSTKKHRELAKKAGVDDYLTKPVGTDTLLDSIETWLKVTTTA